MGTPNDYTDARLREVALLFLHGRTRAIRLAALNELRARGHSGDPVLAARRILNKTKGGRG